MTERIQKLTVAQSDASESMSVDEAVSRFTGEWVLMQVSGFDEARIPCEGVILTHSPRREDISSVLAKQPPRAELPPEAGPFYIFRATPRIRSGPEYDRALASFVTELEALYEAKRAR